MPTLLVRFPGRRYHATPWGHHVNEGQIEWPPSPWRLLRALISGGYTGAVWDEKGPDEIGRSLIEKLAGTLPTYRLPPACGAHTRHYMPTCVLDKGREKTTMVFDTWAQVDDGVMSVIWDVALNDDETSLLASLVDKIGYLGRAESWVEMRLAQTGEGLPAGSACLPSNVPPGPGWEQVPLMTTQSAADYANWRSTSVAEVLDRLPAVDLSKKKLSANERKILEQRKKAEAPFPPDLLACLQVTTTDLRKHGWSQPPGTRRVFYCRRATALEAGSPLQRTPLRHIPPVEVILLSMTTSSGNNHTLPPVDRVVPQAEKLHSQLVGYLNGKYNAALTGCDESGTPLTEPHRHAHLLPLDLDDDGHLDHILIWAPMGLDAVAQATVRAVRKTFAKGGAGPLRLAIAGAGRIADFVGISGHYGEGLQALFGPPGGACQWISRTPFVPARYVKKNGRNSLEGQIIEELTSRGFSEPSEIRVLDPHVHEGARRHRHCIRTRRNGPAAPIDFGFTLVLRFAAPQTGPICLGYGSHFGLGLFVREA